MLCVARDAAAYGIGGEDSDSLTTDKGPSATFLFIGTSGWPK